MGTSISDMYRYQLKLHCFSLLIPKKRSYICNICCVVRDDMSWFKPTSAELHQTGNFEGFSTDWATVPQQLKHHSSSINFASLIYFKPESSNAAAAHAYIKVFIFFEAVIVGPTERLVVSWGGNSGRVVGGSSCSKNWSKNVLRQSQKKFSGYTTRRVFRGLGFESCQVLTPLSSSH